MLIALTDRCFVNATEIVKIDVPDDHTVAIHMRNGDVHLVDPDFRGTKPTVLRLAGEVNTLLKSKGSSQ